MILAQNIVSSVSFDPHTRVKQTPNAVQKKVSSEAFNSLHFAGGGILRTGFPCPVQRINKNPNSEIIDER